MSASDSSRRRMTLAVAMSGRVFATYTVNPRTSYSSMDARSPGGRNAERRREKKPLILEYYMRGRNGFPEQHRPVSPCAACFATSSQPNLTNRSATESIQYRNPVGRGPSLNKSPRCASQRRHVTSLSTSPGLGFPWRTFSSAIGCQKLGQPVPESNFADDKKSAVPQHTHRNIPLSWRFQYAPVKGISVPLSRVIWNANGDN